MIRPTLAEARELSQDFTIIPISLEILSDLKTPIEILRTLRKHSAGWYILESVNSTDSWGRYTFLGFQPVLTVSGRNNTVTTRNTAPSGGPGEEAIQKGNPVDLLKQTIAQYKSPRLPYLPPFTGGFVGYFAYDFAQQVIPGLRLRARGGSAGEEDFRDFHLMLMDKVIAFDHFKQKLFLIVNIAATNLSDNYSRAIAELTDMAKSLFAPPSPSESEKNGAPETVSLCGSFTPSFSEDEFKNMVERVQKHIREGDIFQAVISNRLQAPFQGDLLNTYRILRTTNPSPYMVYMRLDNMEIACSSPETLVSLRNGQVNAFPLAGSAPRGQNGAADEALLTDLLQDEKELAEHDMLVDLARNDIGKVCRFGSVKLEEYRQIKRFSHISHIASHVTGELAPGRDALDVLAAALPAGTLSGAPKKRACEIIDRVEGCRRGIYGGAIGYIDFAGNMDMCIGIRMAVLKNGQVYVQAGAGIVADSDPAKEYQETRAKAQAVVEALKNSGGLKHDTPY